MKQTLLFLSLGLFAQSWTGSGARSVGGIVMDRPWRITYGCTSGSSSVQVFVYRGEDLAEVTQSIDGVEQSTDIDKTGTFRIQISSTCRWKFSVAAR